MLRRRLRRRHSGRLLGRDLVRRLWWRRTGRLLALLRTLRRIARRYRRPALIFHVGLYLSMRLGRGILVLAWSGWWDSMLVSRLTLWIIDSRLRHIRVAVGDRLGSAWLRYA